MHYRSDLIEFKTSEYEGYQKVNSLFAQKLAEIADPDDTIWVHDYHFLSVAKYCRELGMQNKIGFSCTFLLHLYLSGKKFHVLNN